jgi:hypothetical protein
MGPPATDIAFGNQGESIGANIAILQGSTGSLEPLGV